MIPKSGYRFSDRDHAQKEEQDAGRTIMRTMRALMILAAAAAVMSAAAGGGALAQYPTRPITLIVPLATGGSTDTIARIMAEGMRASLGQPVVVENVTGPGGRNGG